MQICSDTLIDLYRQAAHRVHTGERITHLAHAWQCGRLAEKSGASLSLQLASWLHDVGHLHVQSLKPSSDWHPIDHASLGAQMLKPLFGRAVSEPVRLHVVAKRYLVTTRENYARKLSADALQSLARQGGHLSEEECAGFEQDEFFADAIKLRVWDDLGKKEGWFEVAPHDALDDLRALIVSVSSSCVT